MSDSTEKYDTPIPGPSAGGTDVEAVLDRIEQCVEEISQDFDRWVDSRARGPGLYFLVEHESVTEFVAGMGANRWPVEDCGSVFADRETFLDTARSVAFGCDGAVVVRADGTIREAMVRVEQLPNADHRRVEDLPYAGWMGARHMSALETSTRDEVAGAVTLSEEDGRVTVFGDGAFDDVPAASLEAD